MSFFNSLIKGFIRSAVNQVGRDGGRVISNKIYNNNNYIPIKNINEEILNKDISATEIDINHQERIDTSYDNFKYIIAFLICLIPIIGCLFIFFWGKRKLKQTHLTKYRTTYGMIKKNDKRYKGGYRIESIPKTEAYKEIASEENLIILRRKGRIYQYISLGVFFTTLSLSLLEKYVFIR